MTYTDTLNLSVRKYYTEPDEELIKSAFDYVENDHHYQKVANSTKVLGVWDDHDYGLDNGDKRLVIKDVMRKRFLDFLKEPEDSVRRTQPGGIYASYYLDAGRKVKLILLDNRYSRDPHDE